MNTPLRMNIVHNFINKFKPNIVGLVENKLNNKNMAIFQNKIPRQLSIVSNNSM